MLEHPLGFRGIDVGPPGASGTSILP